VTYVVTLEQQDQQRDEVQQRRSRFELSGDTQRTLHLLEAALRDAMHSKTPVSWLRGKGRKHYTAIGVTSQNGTRPSGDFIDSGIVLDDSGLIEASLMEAHEVLVRCEPRIGALVSEGTDASRCFTIVVDLTSK